MNITSVVDLSKAVLQQVEFPQPVPVRVFMKRLDLIHPYVSGNKWFKQKYNLIKAREDGYETLLTFGGAFSNHIYATAAAGKEFGFRTIGMIRGEEHFRLNPTLQFAAEQGMQIHYVTRSDYRKKHLPEFTEWIYSKFGNVYIIPEGGTNQLAIKGTSEIPSLIETDFDYITTACGTAATVSGVICGLQGNKKVLGFAVLRGASFLLKNAEQNVRAFTGKTFSNWSINLEYHFGGYAKINRDLVLFIRQIEEMNGVVLDPVYTGKMLFGVYDLARNGFFGEGKTIVALHTGGQQGIEGMKMRMKEVGPI
ncbi:MAG: dcyD [Ignavibacteria bacterium]|nr:MAG: dcyD [Ignavibacteria bacterium]KAF0161654.1 MAG: dcyD [Ignavibacteria bacterium]